MLESKDDRNTQQRRRSSMGLLRNQETGSSCLREANRGTLILLYCQRHIISTDPECPIHITRAMSGRERGAGCLAPLPLQEPETHLASQSTCRDSPQSLPMSRHCRCPRRSPLVSCRQAWKCVQIRMRSSCSPSGGSAFLYLVVRACREYGNPALF